MKSTFPILSVAILAFLGFVDAAYLTAERYLKLPLPCTTNGCEIVLTSTYSAIGPIPISLLGVFYYLTILFLAVQLYTLGDQKSWIPRLIFGLTTIGFLLSCCLVFVQLALIHAICLYCMVSATISVLLMIASFVLFRSSEKHGF